jgi:hypothetical protein
MEKPKGLAKKVKQEKAKTDPYYDDDIVSQTSKIWDKPSGLAKKVKEAKGKTDDYHADVDTTKSKSKAPKFVKK